MQLTNRGTNKQKKGTGYRIRRQVHHRLVCARFHTPQPSDFPLHWIGSILYVCVWNHAVSKLPIITPNIDKILMKLCANDIGNTQHDAVGLPHWKQAWEGCSSVVREAVGSFYMCGQRLEPSYCPVTPAVCKTWRTPHARSAGSFLWCRSKEHQDMHGTPAERVIMRRYWVGGCNLSARRAQPPFQRTSRDAATTHPFQKPLESKRNSSCTATSDARPSHTPTRQGKYFLLVFSPSSGCGAASTSPGVAAFQGFTSGRSGEACVSWAPRCGTGCGRPAKAGQSSWMENHHQ